MVAITGCGVAGLNSLLSAPSSPARLPGDLDHHALQAEAEPEDRDLVLPGVPDRAELSLDAPDAEAAGDHDAVDLVEHPRRALGGRAARPTAPSG